MAKKKPVKRTAKAPTNPLKMSPGEIAQRDSIVKKIRDAQVELEAAVEDYNHACSRAWAKIRRALVRYNQSLVPARILRANRLAQINGYIEKQGENFGLTAKDASIERMRGEWDAFLLDEISPEEPSAYELPTDNPASDLEYLPAKPEDTDRSGS